MYMLDALLDEPCAQCRWILSHGYFHSSQNDSGRKRIGLSELRTFALAFNNVERTIKPIALLKP